MDMEMTLQNEMIMSMKQTLKIFILMFGGEWFLPHLKAIMMTSARMVPCMNLWLRHPCSGTDRCKHNNNLNNHLISSHPIQFYSIPVQIILFHYIPSHHIPLILCNPILYVCILSCFMNLSHSIWFYSITFHMILSLPIRFHSIWFYPIKHDSTPFHMILFHPIWIYPIQNDSTPFHIIYMIDSTPFH